MNPWTHGPFDSTVNCDHYSESIGELVDGTLDGAARHEIEAHLMACPACAQLVEELLVVRRSARALPPLVPPDGAWARLSSSVARLPSRRTPLWRRSGLPLAAAAVLVLAIAGAAVLRRDAAAPPAGGGVTVDPATASPAELAGSVEAELRKAEFHFENAIAGLDVLARDRQALDPQVAADLQKNLVVIDQAIAESRAALRSQPLSEQAQESLFEAFRSKIALLQDTISLINEMRKGNQAEAARIADDMNNF